MGLKNIEAARYFANGGTEPLFLEILPFQSAIVTNNAEGEVTDSAAAGTAMATGEKVSNGVISTDLPGDGSELETILEIFLP
jgi:alkaline phosphatase